MDARRMSMLMLKQTTIFTGSPLEKKMDILRGGDTAAGRSAWRIVAAADLGGGE